MLRSLLAFGRKKPEPEQKPSVRVVLAQLREAGAADVADAVEEEFEAERAKRQPVALDEYHAVEAKLEAAACEQSRLSEAAIAKVEAARKALENAIVESQAADRARFAAVWPLERRRDLLRMEALALADPRIEAAREAMNASLAELGAMDTSARSFRRVFIGYNQGNAAIYRPASCEAWIASRRAKLAELNAKLTDLKLRVVPDLEGALEVILKQAANGRAEWTFLDGDREEVPDDLAYQFRGQAATA